MYKDSMNMKEQIRYHNTITSAQEADLNVSRLEEDLQNLQWQLAIAEKYQQCLAKQPVQWSDHDEKLQQLLINTIAAYQRELKSINQDLLLVDRIIQYQSKTVASRKGNRSHQDNKSLIFKVEKSRILDFFLNLAHPLLRPHVLKLFQSL